MQLKSLSSFWAALDFQRAQNGVRVKGWKQINPQSYIFLVCQGE